MTRVKIITANVYTANHSELQAREALESRGADLIGTQEAHWLAGLDGYKRHRPDWAGDRFSVHNAIFLSQVHRYEGHGGYRVTDTIEGDKFGPARWITWCRGLVDGHQLVHIDTHINAQIQNRTTGALHSGPRVDEARKHMRALVREIRRQRADGWDPVVTLDSNYARRDGQRRLWRHSPHRAFPRAGLLYLPRHIDGIAVPKGSTVQVAGPFDIPGSDHRGLELTVDIPRRRKRT